MAHQDTCTCGECDGAKLRHQALHALLEISNLANLQTAHQMLNQTGRMPTVVDFREWLIAHIEIFGALGISREELQEIELCELAAQQADSASP